MDEEPPPKPDRLKARISSKVDRLVRIPEGHSKVFRMAWAAAGLIVVLAGLGMTVFPGPAVVVIPVGLAMLAGVFASAHRLLSMSIDRGVDLERWMQDLDRWKKVLGAGAVTCLVAAVAAVVVLR